MLKIYTGLSAETFDDLSEQLQKSDSNVRFHAAMMLREGILIRRRGSAQPFHLLKQRMPKYWFVAGFNNSIAQLCMGQDDKALRKVEKELLK